MAFHFLRSAFICGAFFVSSFSASAQVLPNDQQTCTTAEAEVKVAACTRLINSGRYQGQNLALVYSHRCAGHIDAKAYQRAVEDCSVAIRGAPSFASYYNRALSLENLKKPDEALADYTRAIALNARNPDAFDQRGHIYLNQKNYDAAIKDFTAAIALKAENADEFLTSRGLAYELNKQYDLAIADYTAALMKPGYNIRALINRMELYYKLNRIPQANLDLDLFFQIYSDRAAELLSIQYYAVVLRLTQEFAKTSMHGSVVRVVKGLEKANAKDLEGYEWRQYRGAFYLVLLEVLIDLGRAAEASTIIDRFETYLSILDLQVSKKYAALWDKPEVALSLRLASAPLNELIAWQKAAAASPKSLDLQRGLMRALRLNGKHVEASDLGNKILQDIASYQARPEDVAWFRNELVSNLIAQGLFSEAEPVMKPLFEGNAKEQTFLINQFINFSAAYYMQGRFQEAIDWASKSRGLGSQFGNLWSEKYIACAYHRMGKTAEAETIIQEMTKNTKANYWAVLETHLCLGQPDKAAAVAMLILKDESAQHAALIKLQTCRENPKRGQLEREERAEIMKIRDRPEVQVALNAVGRVIAEPVACGDR